MKCLRLYCPPGSSLPARFLLGIAAALLPACSLFDPDSPVTVLLPPVPPGLEAAFSGYTVRYLTAAGAPEEMGGIPAGTATILSLPKGLLVPVQAFPEGGGFLPAAGALWPAEGDGNTLSLSWESGAAAEIVSRLCGAGFPVRAVNADRLLAELTKRSAGDPWGIDIASVCEAFWYAGMRSDRIRLRQERSLSLSVSPGTWVSANPLAAARAYEAVDGVLSVTVRDGGSSFFLSGAGQRLDLWCDESGWSASNGATGYCGSGTW